MHGCIFSCGCGFVLVLRIAHLQCSSQQVSIQIVEGAEKDCQLYAEVFRDFIKNFRKIIDNSKSSHRELAVAIKGYGYFAAVGDLMIGAWED